MFEKKPSAAQANDHYNADPQATQILQEVIDFRLGQTLDEVRGNAAILSGITKPSNQIQAICVKYIFIKSLYQKMIDMGQAADMMSPLDKIADNGNRGGKDTAGSSNQGEEIVKDFDLELIDNCSYMQTFKIY